MSTKYVESEGRKGGLSARELKIVRSEEFRNDLKEALTVLRDGGIILYPTDTVWGLGCDATNADAVRKIYEIKKRADSKALITLVEKVPSVAWDVMELNSRPTTIVFDGGRNLATNLLAEDGSVGIRVTGELFSRELCFRFKKAIVSTSANLSGEPSPACFEQISPEIIEAVDYVVKYRQKDRSKVQPSTVIKLGAHGEVKVIRP